MARTLKFTVPRDAIEIEIGGDVFTAPPILAPVALGALLDKHAEVQKALGGIEAQAGAGERGTINAVLNVLAKRPSAPDAASTNGIGDVADLGIFDLILVEESARRFAARLYSRDQAFDLAREIMPAIVALVEEYTDRPTQPSPPSSTPSAGDGIDSTDGAPPAMSTPTPLALTGSATSATTG